MPHCLLDHYSRGRGSIEPKQQSKEVLLHLPLLAGALSGVPMRPEDMEKLMDTTNRVEMCT